MSQPISFKVLIVEDEAAIRELYEVKLQREGFTVHTAANGQLGLQAAEDHRPNVILLDLRMPVMGGDEMLMRLRQTKWGSEIRIMILTNISKSEAPHSMRFLNVDRYIVKVHHTPSQIVDMVKEVLS